MAYVAPERLTLLPFPQAWTDGVLSLNAVVLPRGTPMEPLMTGVPGVVDAPAFADGDIQLEARLISSLSKLPDPNDVTSVKDLGVVSPADRRPLFEAVEAQFVIDPALETATKNPTKGGATDQQASHSKLYQRLRVRRPTHAVRQTGRRVCVRHAARVSAWQAARAAALEQDSLGTRDFTVPAAAAARRGGWDCSFRQTSLRMRTSFANGGWLFLGLRATSAYAEHAAAQPELIATYAARIPPLSVNRVLFAPVLFPVSATPLAGAYDEIFGESAGYDDGFAKIVHAAQQTTGMPIGLESNQTAQGPAPPPVRDTGIQLGWDDEQLLIWMNRQIADPDSGDATEPDRSCAATA